jgi:hypothetical protein
LYRQLACRGGGIRGRGRDTIEKPMIPPDYVSRRMVRPGPDRAREAGGGDMTGADR